MADPKTSGFAARLGEAKLRLDALLTRPAAQDVGAGVMTKMRIAVVGAGLMGHGIAQVFAVAGHDVAVTDANAASLATVKERIATNLRDLGDDPTAVERVRPVIALAECVAGADFVVEAVLENLEIKQKLFADIEA